MPAWYKSVLPSSSSSKKKASRSREASEDTSLAPENHETGPIASTSGASAAPNVLAPLSVPAQSPSESRSRPSTAASDGHAPVLGEVPLSSSPTGGSRKANGSAAPPVPDPASHVPRHTTASSVGSASTSSQGHQTTSAVDIPTTTTILSNPLTSHQAASLGSSTGTGLSTGTTGLPPSASMTGMKLLDVDDMIARLLDHGYTAKITKSCPLKNPEINAICQAAREIFLSQPTLLELSPPVKIVGDVHGQYSDLIRLFEMCGFPPSSNYLFLGDYVDRGKQSLETILLLLCYKIKYPENFFLLRGNHECANVTRVYGFYDECKRRCNIKIWKTFIDVFNCLPIAAVVASKIFCVHGGLSPSLASMDDIRRIHRPSDVPDYGLLNDLLWSDPSDTALDWEDNERGVSYCFGKSVIQDFLARYDFDLICRAHMVVEDGYEFWNERTLVTIFSAPNYCGEFDNHAATMSVSEDLLCSFELLKPLDSAALKKEMARGRRRASAAAVEAAALTTVTSNGSVSNAGGINGSLSAVVP